MLHFDVSEWRSSHTGADEMWNGITESWWAETSSLRPVDLGTAVQSGAAALRCRGHARLKRFVTAGRNKWADGSGGSAEIDSRPSGDFIISRKTEMPGRVCSFLQADHFYREGQHPPTSRLIPTPHLVQYTWIPDSRAFTPQQLQENFFFLSC